MTNTLSTITSSINKLCADELSVLKEIVNGVHDSTIDAKTAIQDILMRERSIDSLYCPNCGSTSKYKNGKTPTGIQKYVCKDCSRSYSSSTNSITFSTKKNYRMWEKFIGYLVDGKTLRDLSMLMDISTTTAFSWRHKVMETLEKYEELAVLGGEIQVDETYFKINLKGVKKEKMPRKSKKRGTSTSKRGINNEQVCVLTAIDENDNLHIEVIGQGNPTIKEIEYGLRSKIGKKSIMVTDSKAAYIEVASNNTCQLVQIPSGLHTSGNYNLGSINGIHSEMSSWFNKFRGVSTRHLQKYLKWFRFEKSIKYKVEIENRKRKTLLHSMAEYSNLLVKDIHTREFPVDINLAFS